MLAPCLLSAFPRVSEAQAPGPFGGNTLVCGGGGGGGGRGSLWSQGCRRRGPVPRCRQGTGVWGWRLRPGRFSGGAAGRISTTHEHRGTTGSGKTQRKYQRPDLGGLRVRALGKAGSSGAGAVVCIWPWRLRLASNRDRENFGGCRPSYTRPPT